MKDIKTKIKELNFYDEDFTERLPEIINNSDLEIKNAIIQWLDNKIETEITVNEIPFSLLKECGMDVINAYLALDWIKIDPENAISALKREFYPIEEFLKNITDKKL